ncbi:hypothetical protein EVAR_67320_1 [Eumeta japonica]|uniref:Uncharacterized protein n=1 Tax=Eumeta variegata TaxID=151549 RepID=A0A4C1ZBP1_EUMVA|nr:hypothetical protein EVAR_67320_1 [Eumeta japonica]
MFPSTITLCKQCNLNTRYTLAFRLIPDVGRPQSDTAFLLCRRDDRPDGRDRRDRRDRGPPQPRPAYSQRPARSAMFDPQSLPREGIPRPTRCAARRHVNLPILLRGFLVSDVISPRNPTHGRFHRTLSDLEIYCVTDIRISSPTLTVQTFKYVNY